GGQGSAEREAASGGLTGARMEAQTGQHAQGAQGDQGLWDAQDVREVRAIEIAGRSPSSPSQQATLAAIERFAQKARVHGARTILGVATAAVREGAGGRALLLEVWERCGFSLRAIPGNEEAELAFVGALRALGEDGGGHIDESE